ncbi:hypothetical protein GDO86_003486 [Hymenochirus boettgeri]|uniref:Uncharacterized protein n=1 Tax=Hymenochirus boettgeri TaxID=247094 RepID=A0A8T2K622_9PIPI|nr:hypothetical protein GDO86_003486 [Hymenochirus boettgeri]
MEETSPPGVSGLVLAEGEGEPLNRTRGDREEEERPFYRERRRRRDRPQSAELEFRTGELQASRHRLKHGLGTRLTASSSGPTHRGKTRGLGQLTWTGSVKPGYWITHTVIQTTKPGTGT